MSGISFRATSTSVLRPLFRPNLRHRTGISSSSGHHICSALHTNSKRTQICSQPYKHANCNRYGKLRAHSQTTQPSTMAELNIEEAKRKAGKRAVDDYFDPSYTYVGIGSGTTILYVVDAIKEKLGADNQKIRFVPTGYQSRQVIVKAGLTPVAFDELPEDVLLDVAFDGADEVDEDLNCIKGGGACLFQEKLVAERAKKFVCVADYRKAQTNLLITWPSIPIEVAPIAAHSCLIALRALGSTNPRVRDGLLAKAGPLKTDQDFFIIDAPFPKLLTKAEAQSRREGGEKQGLLEGVGNGVLLPNNGGPGQDGRWEVDELSRRIKLITGVLEVGLFCGMDGREAETKGLKAGGQKPVAVYFGMKDGDVQLRTAKGVS